MVVCELMAPLQLLWQLEPGHQHTSISISVRRFWCILKKPVILSFTSNCVTELMMFMRVYAYMYVSYVIPQYHVLIVYINPIINFIVYINCHWYTWILDCILFAVPFLFLSWMKHQTNSRSSPSLLNPARFGLGCNTCPAHLWQKCSQAWQQTNSPQSWSLSYMVSDKIGHVTMIVLHLDPGW